jgi:hypothetical protein
MKFWDKLRGRRAARREEHEREGRTALERGELETLVRTSARFRDEYTEEGFPSAGAGYLPPP